MINEFCKGDAFVFSKRSTTTAEAKKQPLRVAIIGGGIGGVTSAIQSKQNGMKPTIFEAKATLGGKCFTAHNPNDPNIITEGGAALIAYTQNYQPITAFMEHHGIKGLKPFPTKSNGVHIMEVLDSKGLLGKAEFGINFALQDLRFHHKVVEPYRYARDHAPHSLSDPDLELSFAEFAKKHHIELINDFEIPVYTGFGYGHMRDTATFSVAEYMGDGVIPQMAASEALCGESPLRTVEGGFQHLVESMAEDKDIEKHTSTTITKIIRSSEGVEIEFTENGIPRKEKFDLLINTLSPYYWSSLGMRLTPEEQACVNKVTFNPYTVGFASVKDLKQTDAKGAPKALAKEQQFFAAGLDQNKTGEIALFTTQDERDNPEDGRFGTFYMTPDKRDMKSGPVDVAKEQKQFEEKLQELAKKNNWSIKLHSMQTWESYMSSLPWKIRVMMDNQQMRSDLRTVYVGPAMLGGFESTACVASQVGRTFQNIIKPNLYRLTRPSVPRDVVFLHRQPVADHMQAATAKKRPLPTANPPEFVFLHTDPNAEYRSTLSDHSSAVDSQVSRGMGMRNGGG